MKRSCVVHYLIDQDNVGYRLKVNSFFKNFFICFLNNLKGTKKVFPTLNSFIVHHSIVAENLPVVLDLRAYTSLHTIEDNDFNNEVARNEYVI